MSIDRLRKCTFPNTSAKNSRTDVQNPKKKPAPDDVSSLMNDSDQQQVSCPRLLGTVARSVVAHLPHPLSEVTR